MTLGSKTQKVLTSNIFIIPVAVVAVTVAWLTSLWKKNR